MHNTIDELRAMTENLQDYVIDGDVYKTITVRGEQGESLIKMSIGGILERIAELSKSARAPEVVEAAQTALARERRSQPDRFWNLVAREAKSYADSWEWYLQRVEEGDEQSIRDYRSEARTRTRLQRLLDLDEAQPALNQVRRRTAALDDRLREVWVAERRADEDRYWWLYGAPRAAGA